MDGLEIMNDDPTEVDVLYAKVKIDVPKYNSSFQKMCDQIVEHFSNKGKENFIRNVIFNIKQLHLQV